MARSISLQGVFDGKYSSEIRGNHVCKALSDIYKDVDSISFTDNKIELVSEVSQVLSSLTDWTGYRGVEIPLPRPGWSPKEAEKSNGV